MEPITQYLYFKSGPLILVINFVFLSLILGIVCFKYVKPSFNRTKPVFVIILFLLGIFLRVQFNGQCNRSGELVWEYYENAKGLLNGLNFERGDEIRTLSDSSESKGAIHPAGYSMLMIPLFIIFGYNYNSLIFLNILFSAGMIISIFLIIYLLTNNRRYGLYASFVYTFLKISFPTSVALVPEIPSMFFVSLSVLAIILVHKYKNGLFLAFAISVMAFSLWIRAENIVIIGILFLYLIYSIKNIKTKTIITLLFFFFVFPLSHFFVNSYEMFGPHGKHLEQFSFIPNYKEKFMHTFSISYFYDGLKTHLDYMLNPNNYPVLMIIIVPLSLLALKKEKEYALIWLWLLVYILVWSFWWSTPYSNIELYQTHLYAPLIILFIISVKYLSDKIDRKFRMLFELTFIALIFISMLIQKPYLETISPIDCPIDGLRGILSSVDKDACIVTDNAESSFTTLKEFIKFSARRYDVFTEVENCKQGFYVEPVNISKLSFNRDSFYGSDIEKCRKNILDRNSQWILYRIAC